MDASVNTSTARGMAVISLLASLLWGARFALSLAPQVEGTTLPVCRAYTEDHGSGKPFGAARLTNSTIRPVLGCADPPVASACRSAAGGKRWGNPGGRGCTVQAGAMRAGWRLLTGLPLDLNRASSAELAMLQGVGAKTAAAVVAHRKARGPFKNVNELLKVTGIGKARLAQMRHRLTVRTDLDAF